MSPRDSWVAKWQRIGEFYNVHIVTHSLNFLLFLSDKFVKGCYAVSVTGDLPPDTLDDLRARGIVYRSRDNTDR